MWTLAAIDFGPFMSWAPTMGNGHFGFYILGDLFSLDLITFGNMVYASSTITSLTRTCHPSEYYACATS